LNVSSLQEYNIITSYLYIYLYENDKYGIMALW
jgi:hypothetical protein